MLEVSRRFETWSDKAEAPGIIVPEQRVKQTGSR